jgi:hypothetical protein
MPLFPLSISKRFNEYHSVFSLLSDRLKNVGTGVLFTPSLILLNVFRVELVASADLPLICVSRVMQSHATSCTGRERASSGMKGQGRSCTRRAIVAGGERLATLTIVISPLFSVSRIDSYIRRMIIPRLVLAGFVLICIHCMLLGLPCLILYTILWLWAFLVFILGVNPNIILAKIQQLLSLIP